VELRMMATYDDGLLANQILEKDIHISARLSMWEISNPSICRSIVLTCMETIWRKHGLRVLIINTTPCSHEIARAVYAVTASTAPITLCTCTMCLLFQAFS
jgi:hypothetical protein